MMEEYRKYRDDALKAYQEQRSLRLQLRGGRVTADSEAIGFHREHRHSFGLNDCSLFFFLQTITITNIKSS